MKNRIVIIAACSAALAAAAGCQSAPPANVQQTFNRPTDMVNACFMRTLQWLDGKSTDTAVVAQPMFRCHPPGQPDPDANAAPTDKNPGPIQVPYTLAFLPNTERSELSALDLNPLNSHPLLDLDPTKVGANAVPLGDTPEHASSSDDGCRVATANRRSCDLSLVDAPNLARIALKIETTGTLVTPVRPVTASGRELGAAPAEISFVPQDVTTIPAGADVCAATTRNAVVTFPGCNLVALVELPSGKILDSFRLGAGGVPVAVGPEPVCPAECGAATAPDADGGAGVADGGAAVGAGASALAVQAAGTVLPGGTRTTTNRIYVGSLSDDGIAVFDVTATSLVPQTPIVLHENAGGVGRLRLSIHPYAAQPTSSVEQNVTGPLSDPAAFAHGSFVGHRGAYLYAFAGDGSIRVAEVQAGTECDVAVDPQDPLFVTEPGRRSDACFAVGATGVPRRRFGAVGPGLRLGPLATDINFETYWLFGDNDGLVRFGNSSGAFPLGGAFGYILTATGTTYVLNVDPVLRQPTDPSSGDVQYTEVPPLSNSLRDVNVVAYRSSLSSADGPPRLEVPAVSTIQDSHVSLSAADQPQLETVVTESIKDDPRNAVSAPRDTQVFFPARETVHPQSWTIGWERPLPGSARITGAVQMGPSGAVLADAGASFCKVGAQRHDVLALTGCTDDASCGTGRKCYLSPAATQSTGLCFDANLPKADYDAFVAICDPLAASLKQYEISAAGPTQLSLRPRIDELVKTTLNPCDPSKPAAATGPDQCNPPELIDPLSGGGNRFTCVAIDGVPRCVQTCPPGSTDPGLRCRTGRVCVAKATLHDLGVEANTTADGLCAAAPVLAAEVINTCLPELVPYQITVGHAFTVEGAALAPAQLARAEGDTCVPITGVTAPVLRLPLNAPACTNLPSDPAALANTLAILESVTPSPNPCLYSVNTTENGVARTEIKALFQNAEIRFVLRNLDKYFGNMQIRFTVSGGFRAQTVVVPTSTEFGLPVRIVTSPIEMTLKRAYPDLSLTAVPAGFYDQTFDFVVDTSRVGRLSSSGQLLRLHGASPTYEQFIGGSDPDSASFFPQF